jgi:hypothetical protein
MQVIAWISTRDSRMVQRAAWKRSADNGDPLAGYERSAVEACFSPNGGVTLLSLNMWNCAGRPEAAIVPALICDNDLDWVDQKDSVAEESVTALQECLNSGTVTTTHRDATGNRTEIPKDDWEDRYLDPGPNETELLAYRKGAKVPEWDWRDVRLSRDEVVQEWPARATDGDPVKGMRKGGRQQNPFWEEMRHIAEEWLQEEGYPRSGDGRQAFLERLIMEESIKRGKSLSESTVRRHVTNWIADHKQHLGAVA